MAEIKNSDSLIQIFGYWPTFHDAEVHSIYLDRNGRDEHRGPTLEAKVHVFEMTSEVDSRGAYVLRHHTLVTLRFLQIDCLQADDFNYQNALWELAITDVSDSQLEDIKFEVKFASSFGLGLSFSCQAVEVFAVEPYSAQSGGTQGPPMRGPGRPMG